MTTMHSTFSSVRARAIEHVFLYEMHRRAWVRGKPLEVSESEVDFRGYDLVLEYDGVVRHVQMKTGKRNYNPVPVNCALEEKSSGCVVKLLVDDELVVTGWLFFGAKPKKPLPSMRSFPLARHTKADSHGHKAERPNARKVSSGKFNSLGSWDCLFSALFDG